MLFTKRKGSESFLLSGHVETWKEWAIWGEFFILPPGLDPCFFSIIPVRSYHNRPLIFFFFKEYISLRSVSLSCKSTELQEVVMGASDLEPIACRCRQSHRFVTSI